MDNKYKVGQKVKYEYFFMAPEQGQIGLSEWSSYEYGTIISIKESEALIEIKDGTRTWVEMRHIVEEVNNG